MKEVSIAMNGYRKLTWTYLRSLLQQMPGVDDVFRIY
jgi:hypothetical protein